MKKQGKLLIIGFGPGRLEHITGRALAALEESEAVIGYNTYVDLIKPLLRHQEIVGTGMTEEVSRAQEAVRRAEAGQTIAVISSGDAGVYGMAGLVYEVLIERGWSRGEGVEVEVIPGISAIQSCSSLLGAPIMHDSCTISLSDHLTPWESIAERVEAAAEADFVIAFYNPRSGKRTRQIEEARHILLRYRDPATPVGIVKSAYRDRQMTVVTTLQDMLEHEIGMLSTVIVGNSATLVYEGVMVTPRGYERKYSLGADTQALKPHERLRTAAEPWSLAAMTGGEAGRDAALRAGAAPKGSAGERAALNVRNGAAEYTALTPGKGANEQAAESMGNEAGKLAAIHPGGSAHGERVQSMGCGDSQAHPSAACELEIAPATGSRTFSGEQMKLLAELAGAEGSLVYTRDGYFLLRSSEAEQAGIAAALTAAGLNVTLPGDFVKVGTCGFCELRKQDGLGAAQRLYKLLNGQPVPRELRISVAGCGMACNSAVLEDIGLIWSRGSFELYLGGKKSGRGAHPGRLVREGMNEDEAVTAVVEVARQYHAEGRVNERFHAFYERTGIGSKEMSAEVSAMDSTASHEGSSSAAQGDSGKRTVLLVGHGSRVEQGNEELREFTRMLAARRPELAFETCFIELSAPSISEGIARCVQGGAATIYVVPIILFAAGHSKLDIPMALDEAKLKYPGVEFVYGRPVGVQERAVDILLDRIGEAVPLHAPELMNGLSEDSTIAGLETAAAVSEALDAGTARAGERSSAVEDKDTIVLLMGRGGSDPDANSDFFKLTRLLWERTSYRSVEACFIAITKPLLPEGLERCLALGARKIVVLPYLLFNGLLMQQFNEAVRLFAAIHPEIEVEIGSYLGTHPLLADMLLGRIDETLEGQAYSNCDNCKYREEAAAHHHHHHHGDSHDHDGGHDHEGYHHGHSHGHDGGHHHHEGCHHKHGHGHDGGHHHHEGCHHGHSHGHDGGHHHEGCHHKHGHGHDGGHHHEGPEGHVPAAASVEATPRKEH